jgi:RND family efflux transporter MFP subunit
MSHLISRKLTLFALYVLTSLAAVVAVVAQATSTALAAPAAAADPAAPQVAVIKAASQTVAVGFEFDGVVEPVKQSTVSAQAAGRIVQFLAVAGDRVRAGQLLAVIDDRDTQEGLQRSQAQVAQAQAELRNAQANAKRTRDLQAQGFLSQAALDTAEANLQSAQAGRDQAAAGARQSALAQGFTRVTAPYDGWVRETLAQAGDLAVAGKPLLTMYAPQPLRAVVHVPMSRGAAARSATQIEVRTGGNGSATWIKPVNREVLPVADAVAQTVEWLCGGPRRTALARTAGAGAFQRQRSGAHAGSRDSGLAARRADGRVRGFGPGRLRAQGRAARGRAQRGRRRGAGGARARGPGRC